MKTVAEGTVVQQRSRAEASMRFRRYEGARCYASARARKALKHRHCHFRRCCHRVHRARMIITNSANGGGQGKVGRECWCAPRGLAARPPSRALLAIIGGDLDAPPSLQTTNSSTTSLCGFCSGNQGYADD